jgi:23S rRNA (guanosine2251-2'-O)-methyltransferase
MPFLAGRNAVLEAIRAGRRVRRIVVENSLRASDPAVRDVLDAAAEARIPIERAPRARLNTIHPRHQGVAAEVDPFAYTPFPALKDRAREAGAAALVLALDELQDPQNLGSLLRTALAVSATGVVVPERRAVGVNPTVVRASAGAAEHLAICQVPNLARALTELKDIGAWVVGLDAHAGEVYDQIDVDGPLVVVVGSEGSGLRRLVRETCDFVVRLPMAGPTDSLNAAVAGSIVLYDIFRRRDRASRIGR